jgi:hypothetical protein
MGLGRIQQRRVRIECLEIRGLVVLTICYLKLRLLIVLPGSSYMEAPHLTKILLEMKYRERKEAAPMRVEYIGRQS